MASVWKEYRAGKALRLLNTASGSSKDTLTYKDVNGNEYTKVYGVKIRTSEQYDPTAAVHYGCRYSYLTPYASEEALADFNSSDYEVPTTLSTNLPTNYSRMETISSQSKRVVVYSIVVSNDREVAVDLKSIKFTKNMIVNGSDGRAECLAYVYYLDNPITLDVGESVGFAITLMSEDH